MFYVPEESPLKKLKYWKRSEKDILKEQNGKMQRIRAMNASQVHTIIRLRKKNESLMLGNAEYIKAKIGGQISARSHVMVDLAIFSDFFHSSDHLLEEQKAVILESKTIGSLKTVFNRLFCQKGQFSRWRLCGFEKLQVLAK